MEVKNEPILGFKEGSKERSELETVKTHLTHCLWCPDTLNMCVSDSGLLCLQALRHLKGKTEEIPCVVGNEEVWTKDIRYQLSCELIISLVSVPACAL